jgi:hypothetical protein
MQKQYMHNAKYGNPGGFHTMRPQFVMKGEQVFKSEYHPDVRANAEEGTKAVLTKRGDKLFAAGQHADGSAPHALYEIRGDKIHTTSHHPNHVHDSHVFELGPVKDDQNFIDNVIKNA